MWVIQNQQKKALFVFTERGTTQCQSQALVISPCMRGYPVQEVGGAVLDLRFRCSETSEGIWFPHEDCFVGHYVRGLGYMNTNVPGGGGGCCQTTRHHFTVRASNIATT